VQNLSDLQTSADSQATKLATGQNVSLVDSVLAMEQTSLSFKLAMQVRDKVVEAYQDVMRMQM
jgi:flagellar hook-basal body complex protein FliE